MEEKMAHRIYVTALLVTALCVLILTDATVAYWADAQSGGSWADFLFNVDPFGSYRPDSLMFPWSYGWK